MERITITHLNRLLARLQRETGAPEMKWTPRADGKCNECPVGAYLINEGSATYGRSWTLVQMVNDAGAERTILRANTARGLYNMMHAYLDGYLAAPKADLW